MALGRPQVWPPCPGVHSTCAHGRARHLPIPPKTHLHTGLSDHGSLARDCGQRRARAAAVSQEAQGPLPRLLPSETPISCTPARASAVLCPGITPTPPIPLWPGGGAELARKPRSQRPPPWQVGVLEALVSLLYLGLVPAAQGSAVSPRGSHRLEGRCRGPVSRVCAPMGQKPRDLSRGAGSAGLRCVPAILPLLQTFPNSVCLNVLGWPFSPESQSLARHMWAAHGDGICVIQTIR